MYYFVERSVVVLKPKQPFLDWINNSFDNVPQHLTLSALRLDCNSYLIPEVEEIEDGIKYVDSKYTELFALELATWTEDETLWPTDLSLKMFWEWFEVFVYPTSIDITEDNFAEQEDSTIH